MQTNLQEIQNTLKTILRDQKHVLKVKYDSEEKGMEICGTKKAMQGKQKVDGYYFASIVPKPKDIRLYFFPIYTHPDAYELSEDMKKALKGKSCFHIKKLSAEMEAELKGMVKKGVELYKRDGLI